MLDQWEQSFLNSKAGSGKINWDLEKVLVDNIVFNLEKGDRRYLVLMLLVGLLLNPIISLAYAVRTLSLPQFNSLKVYGLILIDFLSLGSITMYIARSLRNGNILSEKFRTVPKYRELLLGHLAISNTIKILPREAINRNDRLITEYENLDEADFAELLSSYWIEVGRIPPEWTLDIKQENSDSSAKNEDLDLPVPGLIIYRILILIRWILLLVASLGVLLAPFGQYEAGILLRALAGVTALVVAISLDRLYRWIVLDPIEKYGKRNRY